MNNNIREQLRRWQEQLPDRGSDPVTLHDLADRGDSGATQNIITRPQDGDRLSDVSNEEDTGDHDNMIAADSEDQVPEVTQSLPFLQQGDLVELLLGSQTSSIHDPGLIVYRGASGPILAIFIRNLETQSQFYTMYGRWVHRVTRKIYYSVPRFVSRSLVAHILPYLPQTEVEEAKIDQMQAMDPGVPREAGAYLIKPMLAFFDASDEAYRKLARQFAVIHDRMAHGTDVRYATLEEIATKVLAQGHSGKWPATTLWALHRALTQNEYGFSIDQRNHRVTGSFEIRPKKEVETVEQVRTWMRGYQEDLIANATAAAMGNPNKSEGLHESQHIAGFLRKARAVIQLSRKRRAATFSGAVGPSPVKVDYNTTSDKSTYRSIALNEYPFNHADTQIVRVIEAWAAARTINPSSSLASLGPMLIRATGMYEGYLLGTQTGFMFLQEIGFVEPWANRRNFETRLALPGNEFDPKTDKLWRKSESAALRKVSDAPNDDMEGLRKDWGDLEVFCIDHEAAAEIDDGVSLERVGDSSEFWVHIHTANPSAFISPDNAMGRYAAHLTETVYFPDVLYPMLSPALTQKYFSLTADRPSLTFSAKLTQEGEILDIKITPGTVRNVSHVTPETLDRALSGEEAETSPSRTARLTVGGEMPASPHKAHHKNMLPTLSLSQQETLRTLRDLGAAVRRRREGQGAVAVRLPKPEASVYLNNSPNTVVHPWRERARYIEGDPIISWHLNVFDQGADPTLYTNEMLVPDLMILAGEIAGQWCRDRSVPVIYRGALVNPEGQSPEAFRREHLDPATERLGYTPLALVSKYLRLIGRGVSTPYPIKHTIIGSEAYVKVTSPLRRYGDLLAHWQIEAALRHEARTGQSLLNDRNNSKDFLPYSYSQIESMIPRVSVRERMISKAKEVSQRHWILLLLLRAHYFKEAALPETFTMYIHSKGQIRVDGKHSGYLEELGLNVDMPDNPTTKDNGGVEIGDRWEVKLHHIDVYLRSCTVVPVRLIERAEPLDLD